MKNGKSWNVRNNVYDTIPGIQHSFVNTKDDPTICDMCDTKISIEHILVSYPKSLRQKCPLYILKYIGIQK